MKEVKRAIRERTDEINKMAEKASAEIKAVEKFLAKNEVGVEAYLPKVKEDAYARYGYARVNGVWHIVIKKLDGDVWKATACNRADRIRVAKRLSDILEAVNDNLEDLVEEAKGADASHE